MRVSLALLTVCLLTAGTQAAIWQYDMSKPFDDAAQPSPMIEVGDGCGDLAAGDFNPPENAGTNLSGDPGTAGLVYARFSDTGGNGNDGWYRADMAGAFTLDMTIQGEEYVANAGTGRSMSIRDASGVGRGIQIEPSQDGGNGVNLEFVSGGGVVAGIWFPKTTDDHVWHNIRLSMPGDGNVYVYDCSVPMPYILRGTVGLGGSGYAGELGAGPGWALNSLSGGITTNSKWIAAGFSVDTERALGENDLFIPEPATLSLLLCGATLLLRRRW